MSAEHYRPKDVYCLVEKFALPTTHIPRCTSYNVLYAKTFLFYMQFRLKIRLSNPDLSSFPRKLLHKWARNFIICSFRSSTKFL